MALARDGFGARWLWREMRLCGVLVGYQPAIERPRQRDEQGGPDATVRRSGPGLHSNGVIARRPTGPPLRGRADLRGTRVSNRPFCVQRRFQLLGASPDGASHAAAEPPAVAPPSADQPVIVWCTVQRRRRVSRRSLERSKRIPTLSTSGHIHATAASASGAFWEPHDPHARFCSTCIAHLSA
jgi:hypothetical protein